MPALTDVLRALSRRTALLAGGLAAAGCAPGAGPAVDWGLGARIGHRIEADINRDLDPGDAAALLTNAVNVGLVLDAETQRAIFTGELGLTARYYIGEDEALAGTGDVDPQLDLSARWRNATTTLGATGSLAVAPVDADQIDDTGVVDATATQVSVSAGLSVAEQIDARNTLSVALDARVRDFSDGTADLTPTRTVSGTLSWERSLTETTDATARLGLRNFSADDAEGTRSQTLDLGVDLDHRRTPRHTVRLSAGVSAVRTIEEIAGGGPDVEIGFTGAAGLDYRLARLTAGIELSQSIEPSSVGALQAFTRLGARLGYPISDRESLNLGLSLTRRAPVSGGADSDTLESLSITPGYAWQVGPETRVTLGYTFRATRDSADGTALGHRLFIALDRALALQD